MKLSEAMEVLKRKKKCVERECNYECDTCPYRWTAEERDEAIDTVIQVYDLIFGAPKKDYDTFK